MPGLCVEGCEPETGRREYSQYSSRGFNIRVVIKLFRSLTTAHYSGEDTHSLHRKILDSRVSGGSCRCHKRSHHVLSNTFSICAAPLESYLKFLTSFRENGPGLMKWNTGASRSNRVPTTQVRRGKNFASPFPTGYITRSKNTLDTYGCCIGLKT